MKQAVIFDYGNVIDIFDPYIFFEKLSKHSKMDATEARACVSGSGFTELYEKGFITTDEYHQFICNMGFDITLDDFIEAHTNKFEANEPMHDLIRKLKSNDYQIGILSNTNQMDYDERIIRSPIIPYVDAITVSHDIEKRKPHPHMYRDILDKLLVCPEEAVFLDDMERNIDGARAVGLDAIRYDHRDHDDIVRRLRDEYGIKIK